VSIGWKHPRGPWHQHFACRGRLGPQRPARHRGLLWLEQRHLGVRIRLRIGLQQRLGLIRQVERLLFVLVVGLVQRLGQRLRLQQRPGLLGDREQSERRSDRGKSDHQLSKEVEARAMGSNAWPIPTQSSDCMGRIELQ
jgi:hypothetical protein